MSNYSGEYPSCLRLFHACRMLRNRRRARTTYGPVRLGKVRTCTVGDLREAAVELGVLLHRTLGSGVERVIRLTDKVVDAEAHHLLDGQALALASTSSRRISSSEREIVSVAMIGSFA